MIAIAAALLLAAPAPAHDAFAQDAWGHFARALALAHSRDSVDIKTDGRSGDALLFRLRLIRQSLENRPREYRTDSRACPAVAQVLAAAARLSPPAIAPPSLADNSPIILDGAGYSLRMPARNGTIAWTSNVGTPLATWVEDSLAKLEPCWRPAAD
jgi:hypothetical protein